jgi:hypothetical chaperone protein
VKIGIDFGTTNSAVAVVRPDGSPAILELFPGQRFQRTVIHGSTEGEIRFGNAAFDAYVEADLTGRFLRSLKAFLAYDVPKTTVAGRRYAFPELVAAYLRFLTERTEAVTGQRVTEVVLGRPVHFHDEPQKDADALGRLEAAVADAGIKHWRLQLEPVAAAHLYEHGLDRERIVLVGDFGGGTSDFAVLRVGPDRIRRPDRRDDVLATSGVAKAGDALDGRFMDTFLMGYFGRGAKVRGRSGEWEVWTHQLQHDIQKLYYLHLLRDPELERRLKRVEPRMEDPRVIRRLLRLVFDDLGYPMAWAIEATKRALSAVDETTFVFREFYNPALDLAHPVSLAAYAEGSAELLAAYDAAITEALARAGLDRDGIDDVFLTGGTSQLPFIRRLFADRFGAGKLRGADSFTSVCEGLALAAGR